MGCHFQLVATLMLLCSVSAVCAVNITSVLEGFSNFTMLNTLLTATGVANEINSKSSFTLLAPDDSVLDPLVKVLNNTVPVEFVTNILRYHVLLQYFDIPEIKTIVNSSGELVATLYQTTINAANLNGFVNLSLESSSIKIGWPVTGSPPNATVITNLTQSPFSFSVLQIDRVLIPIGLQTSIPPSPSPAPAPSPSLAPPNITDALEKAGKFTLLLRLLNQTGLASALAAKETGSGITIFAPTDDAFNALPSNALASLSDAQKKTVILYHVLPEFFSLTQLQSLSNSDMQTLASGSSGKFTVNVTSSTGIVTIATGVDTAQVSATLVNQAPVSVFAIDKVLLPPEFFHHPGPSPAPAPAPTPAPAPAPAVPAPAPIPHVTPGPSPFILSPPPPPPTSTPEAPGPGAGSNDAPTSVFACNLLLAAALISSSLLL
ncbi:hypothetical protein O6H91_01G033300 [Diphasiastrum complanatum]|uniref:Uncharacterized protein n=2 Tax=Diphasiastrum complanatum TaxID=34168 RepID=A0ACC2EPM6_DIPCM|nr:hypothetical protein O6H91_01G033300 [Diphasiastrum complanatum]